MSRKRKVKNISGQEDIVFRQIRNNNRRGNFSRTSELIMGILKSEDIQQNKENILERVYAEIRC